MRTLHVVPKPLCLKFLSQISGLHYIQLNPGLVLVSLPFEDHAFMNNPQTQSLPHPLSGLSIGSHPQFPLLQQVLGALATDSSWQLGQRAAKIHPLMRI